MANLTVDNLKQIVQSGDVERMFSQNTGVSGSPGMSAGAEMRVTQEMQKNGMSTESIGLPGDSGQTFSNVLRQSVGKVNDMQVEADRAIKELVAGRTKNIHETMLTMERADTSLKLMMQVRNKVLDAYREVMRMQV